MTAPQLLELRQVTRSFPLPSGKTLDVLRGLDLSLHSGESVAILGPSGSGKSTLLNIVGTLDRPTDGEVTFAGDSLAGLTDKALADFRSRQVGFVFQLHHLLPQCTAIENVLVPTLAPHAPHREDAVERAEALLERVGLADRKDSFPAMLSGGERQRVAVVRALINRPRLLLADEPTGALDTASARELGDLLVELNREMQTTLLVVTHSPQLADRMGRSLTLRDGILGPLDS